MQIVHKVNEFLTAIFPDLINASNNEICEAVQAFFSYDGNIPTVSIQDDVITINIIAKNTTAHEIEFQKAVSLCNKGNLEEAKKIIENLIIQNPTNSEYHRVLGQILSDQGNQDEAINVLIDALRWDATNGWALLMMGNIFAKHKKDFKTAMLYYNQAIASNKADHITLVNIAYLFYQEGKFEVAKDFVHKSIQLNNKYPNAFLVLSIIALAENNLQEAFNKALQAIQYTTQKDAIYQNAVKQAFDIANRISQESWGKKIYQEYAYKLMDEGGTPIEILVDEEISSPAKVEIAEVHNRSEHIIKYKASYPAVEHLIMHELVHIDLVYQARKEEINHLFYSTQQNKINFDNSMKASFEKLKKAVNNEAKAKQFFDTIFQYLNLQIYNTPIDLFIEDYLYKQHPELRPFQFISIFRLMQDAIKAVTDERHQDLTPKKIISITKTLSLVNAMQYKELFGLDMIKDLKPTNAELRQAEDFYQEYLEYQNDRKPGEEYELIKHWAEDLGADSYFELETESKFNRSKNVDDFLENLQKDPYGLDEPEDPVQKREMEKFQMQQENSGINMAVVMFMVDALNHFKGKTNEEIKKTAFETAMLGMQGINTDKKDYIISSVSNKRYTGNQVLAYYYTAWALTIPEQLQNLGLDFEKEYELAKTIQTI